MRATRTNLKRLIAALPERARAPYELDLEEARDQEDLGWLAADLADAVECYAPRKSKIMLDTEVVPE
jgi:hypothetical protein